MTEFKPGKMLKASWKSLRRRYFMNVLVVFAVAIIIGGYSLGTKTTPVNLERKLDPGTEVARELILGSVTGQSNADSLEDLLDNLSKKEIIPADITAKTTGGQYTKGAFSLFINQISTEGSFLFGILNGVNMLLFKGSISRSVVIFSFVFIMVLFNLFVSNIITVGKCRYFLEHRRYSNTRGDRILFVFKFGKTFNVAKVMFFKSLFQTLWNITIIGGVIKAYQYSMIPYILAENPDIKWKEAFFLSKQMTQGDKRRLFLLDLILTPGYLISPFTYNILYYFFMEPIRECVYAEAYMTLREMKRDSIPTAGLLLNDKMLAVSEVSATPYPDSEYVLPVHHRRQWMKIDYDRDYSFSTIVLFFFTYSLVGYIWEVFYTLLNEGILVNRGTMTGPWLPIYGVGGMVIIVLLKPLRKSPLLMFAGTTVACGILEYFASWLLEMMFNAKWWDYKGYFLNINGRVCLEGLLVFGLAGVAFTYIFSPLLDNLYSVIGSKARKIIISALVLVFAVDFVLCAIQPNTGDGITYGEDGMGKDTVVYETQQEAGT